MAATGSARPRFTRAAHTTPFAASMLAFRARIVMRRALRERYQF